MVAVERSLISLLSARTIFWRFFGDFFLEGGRTRPLAVQFAQEGPVAPGVCGAVRGLQKGLPLVLAFLANEPLDVPVQQLDGRVEGVVSAALISLRDERLHSIGEMAAVIPNITGGDMVSSDVTENTPEDFLVNRARGVVTVSLPSRERRRCRSGTLSGVRNGRAESPWERSGTY